VPFYSMTIKDFNKLKIGDSVCLPNTWKKGSYTQTEVLEIDKIFKKVRVLLHSKFLSYKYLPKNKDIKNITGFVGVCK
jgi:hypothetical protein